MAQLLPLPQGRTATRENGDRPGSRSCCLVVRNAGRLAQAPGPAHGKSALEPRSWQRPRPVPEQIFMDCGRHRDRPARVRQASKRGKHIHEKPRRRRREAMDLARLARAAALKQGVIQDKAVPARLRQALVCQQSGFFGRFLSLKIDAGPRGLRRNRSRMPASELDYPQDVRAAGWRSI